MKDFLRAGWGAIFLSLLGLAALFWLAGGEPVWATPGQDPLHQTAIGPITLQSDRRTASPGDSVNFICRVTNTENVSMLDAQAVVPIPDPLIVEDATVSQGVVTVTLGLPTAELLRPKGRSAPLLRPDNTVVAAFGKIQPGQDAELKIKAIIRQDAEPGTQIIISARLFYDGRRVDSNLVTISLPEAWLPVTGERFPPALAWNWIALTLLGLLPLSYLVWRLYPARKK
ncbi:MAG: hypothetical protein ACUVV0_06600 [Anaerolineae bacterium]